MAGDRAEAEAEHVVAGGDGGILEAGDGADAWEAVGGAGPQTGPRLDASEVVRTEGGEELAKALDNALQSGAVDG